MSAEGTQISVKGRQVAVPSMVADGFTVVATGRLLKVAMVKSEDYLPRDPSADPEAILRDLRKGRLGADIFSFVQRIPDTTPKFTYPHEMDNVAALPILGYKEWWEGRLNQDTRRCVRVAAKRGLTVRPAVFDDAFCEGIRGIYNETPIRQGRKFWHYGKDLETVRKENGTFADRSEFIGAYFGDEMVGFLKMVYVGPVASIMQIISKMSHYDRRPMNALMAKAVEICNEKKCSHLLYRKYTYNHGLPDSLTEFKRRNGFEQVNLPRYFVPLTAKGRLAIGLGVQTGLGGLVPKKMVVAFRNFRSNFYKSKDGN